MIAALKQVCLGSLLNRRSVGVPHVHRPSPILRSRIEWRDILPFSGLSLPDDGTSGIALRLLACVVHEIAAAIVIPWRYQPQRPRVAIPHRWYRRED